MGTITVNHIEDAARRIAPYVHRTDVLSSTRLNERVGCRLLFKCENLQRGGAFKARGAHNAVLQLSAGERKNGVATHSSGNHAAALALAARAVGVPAYVVMPETAPKVKIDAVRAYGGEITFCAPTLPAREEALADLVSRTGAHFLHPYDHADIIAGQGTCVLELTEQLDEPPDVLLVPVGGGGLLSGSAIASRARWPQTAIIGAEPAGADDAQRGFRSGTRQTHIEPNTVADGLRSTVGVLNFDIIRNNVNDILAASDAAIIEAMRLVWTRMKVIVEPSAAVTLAVILEHPDHFAEKTVAAVFSGGNVDIDALPW